MADVVVNPLVELEPRAGDELLSPEALKQLDLVARLKSPPDFKRFPGSTILRKFRTGEVVCRQGDAGASAYYILTSDDVARLRQWQLTAAESPTAGADKSAATHTAAAAHGRGANAAARRVATAQLVLEGQAAAKPRGFFARLAPSWLGRQRAAAVEPKYIPNDGPADIEYRTRQAPLFEGEVFGEMSCTTLAPRSATITVDADCYMLEFLRNIFDKIQKDAGYRERMDAIYRERVLANHLRRLELLEDLPQADLDFISERVELEVVDPGTILCDEGDRADAVYLIRNGLVQVVTDVNVRLRAADVADGRALCQALQAGAAPPAPEPPAAAETKPPAAATSPAAAAAPKGAGADPLAMLGAVKAKPKATLSPVQRVWQALPEAARKLAAELAAAAAAPSPQAIDDLLEAMNQLARSRDFVGAEEFAATLERDAACAPARVFPKGLKGVKKDWSELEVRIGGRLLWQALFPQHVRQRAFSGPPRVINYLSRGDMFGEMGVLLQQARSATCLAYDHPPGEGRREPGRVELVRIGAEVFTALLERSPTFKTKVERVVQARQARDAAAAQQAPWSAAQSVLASPEFQELGLIQGQQLLLIDLDRCTRCGDCVRACIGTHDDGYSRLFLDGPRFDRFLVPSACRQCLNPACMMGCPVGSIQRGASGQIEIRDWCIGCGMCANQCPYDSIQMHDTGIIPAAAPGWRMQTLSRAGSGWQEPRVRDGHWPLVSTPVRCDLEVLAVAQGGEAAVEITSPLCLRYAFELPAGQLNAGGQYRLSLTSQASRVTVWLGGRELTLAQDEKQKKKGEYEVTLAGEMLARRGNVLAVALEPPLKYGQTVLAARLDHVPHLETALPGVGEAEVKLVTEKAVVCDLCSELAGQEPVCVTMCPHNAAMRVDSRFEFPVR